MNKLIIISRYNENIEWSKELDGDIMIFNKGNEWPWEDIPRIDIENTGREAETFLRAICYAYENDKIKDYDHLVFLQGNPFDHCENTIELVNKYDKDSLFPLTDHINPINFSSEDYIFDVHVSTINKFLNPELKLAFPIFNPQGEECISEDFSEHIHKMRMIAAICKIPLKGEYVWPSSAQYIVPVELITNKSLDWWINLYKLFSCVNCLIPKDQLSAECLFERMWPLFYNYKEEK